MGQEFERGSREETEGISPSLAFTGKEMKGKKRISVCTVLLKHGDQMLPKLSKAFLYALLIN